MEVLPKFGDGEIVQTKDAGELLLGKSLLGLHDGRALTAEDLNLAGRVVYAGAGGSTQGGTYEERLAVGSVIFNRLGRRIPGGSSGTVSGVVSAPAQFASVTGTFVDRLKFQNSNPNIAGTLRPADCDDLRASLNAVRVLMSGNRERYSYTFVQVGSLLQRRRPHWRERVWRLLHYGLPEEVIECGVCCSRLPHG